MEQGLESNSNLQGNVLADHLSGHDTGNGQQTAGLVGILGMNFG